MIIDVDSKLDEIEIIPKNELMEVLQNVQTIISTVKGTCPMYREFGIDSRALDEPIAAAQAKLSAEIATAIRTFEPRARLQRVRYSDNPIDGQLTPVVTVEIIQKNLRG